MMPLSFGLLMRQKLGPLTPATRRRIPWRILPIWVSTLCASPLAYAQAPEASPLGGPGVDSLGAPENARALAPTLRNEADAARDLPILGIEVAGNRRVTAEDILTYLREKRGDPFSPEKLAQDVRELWGSGFFDDVVVELERSDVGVTLRFLVRERATIADVEFVGND